MKYYFFLFLFLLDVGCTEKPEPDYELLNLSEQFLLEVKRNNSTSEIELELASITRTQLRNGLIDDRSKKAFWLNIYNAYFQRLGKSDSTVDLTIFKKPLISIADTLISFDDLEHGILRKKADYNFEDLSVSEVDYRIHFALNCGAKSCPPIAFYNYAELNDQLDQATKLFLIQSSAVNPDQKIIKISEVMNWFLEDFGGSHQTLLTIIEQYIEKDLSGYRVEFEPWDWSAQFSNFVEN